MISVVACCHGAKLCAHAAQDIRSQHMYGRAWAFLWRPECKTWHEVQYQGTLSCSFQVCSSYLESIKNECPTTKKFWILYNVSVLVAEVPHSLECLYKSPYALSFPDDDEWAVASFCRRL